MRPLAEKHLTDTRHGLSTLSVTEARTAAPIGHTSQRFLSTRAGESMGCPRRREVSFSARRPSPRSPSTSSPSMWRLEEMRDATRKNEKA